MPLFRDRHLFHGAPGRVGAAFVRPHADVVGLALCQRFDGFADNEVRFINPQKYLCMDILTEESRFFVNPETGDIHDVLC